MTPTIRYWIRNSGTMMTEQVYAGAFLFWLYNSRIGYGLEQLVFRHTLISKLYGALHETSWSKRLIPGFIRTMGVRMEESLKAPSEFTSFNDFFRREINLAQRRIMSDDLVCIAPSDGKILVFPATAPCQTFQIKRHTFQLKSFLNDDELVRRFSGGGMLVSRLCLKDYHHFHFPDSGVPHGAKSINGYLHAGGPYAQSYVIPFYSENHRMLTLFDSRHFGTIAVIEVGAFTVGSIRQRYTPDTSVEKGAHKGFFELGGSTVVLLFEKGRIAFDPDLCENSRKGIETYVEFGDSIGRALL